MKSTNILLKSTRSRIVIIVVRWATTIRTYGMNEAESEGGEAFKIRRRICEQR